MADLEKLLLEAAGRTRSSAKKPRKASNLDDIDNSDFARKKEAASSQIPFKKRYEQNKKDDDDDDDDDDSDVGSDLYKDEDDRRRLAEMTELEREMILTDRAAKRDDKSFKEKLNLNAKRGQPSRSSARNADKAAAMGSALNRLREKRMRHQDSKGGNGNGNGAARRHKERDPSPESLSCSSESDEDDERSYEEEEEDGKMVESDDDDGDDDDEKGIPGSEPPLFEDLKGITIRRTKLGKWLMEPFFEELIVGCFVRIGIGMSKSGPVYRLCEVQSVDSLDPEVEYKIEGRSTRKCLVCFWGNESSATKWKMDAVSDSAPTEDEFNQWAKEVKRSGGRMVRSRDVSEKMESMERVSAFVYSATTVKQMVEEKKKHASSRPVNMAVEKDRLRRKLEVAESKCDEAEAERIRMRLTELEAASRVAQERDAKALKLSEMNKRNKAENFKNASERPAAANGLRAGDAGYDPFSRRWTRSRNYYDSKARDEAENGSKDAGEAMALVAAVGARESLEAVGVAEPKKFEVSLSMEMVTSLGGGQGAQVGYLARKQRIEARIGCQVLENDGKRHTQTLSVGDYKRRRGLV